MVEAICNIVIYIATGALIANAILSKRKESIILGVIILAFYVIKEYIL